MPNKLPRRYRMADNEKVIEEDSRAARETETREVQSRAQSWEPQSKLPNPNPHRS